MSSSSRRSEPALDNDADDDVGGTLVGSKMSSANCSSLNATQRYTGWPKKESHHQFFFSKKIVLKIANEIRFRRKVKV